MYGQGLPQIPGMAHVPGMQPFQQQFGHPGMMPAVVGGGLSSSVGVSSSASGPAFGAQQEAGAAGNASAASAASGASYDFSSLTSTAFGK